MLSSDFATGLDMVADVLLNPIFPADELEREREVQIAGIHAPRRFAQERQHRDAPRMFGDAGYGLDTLGREVTVTKISRPPT